MVASKEGAGLDGCQDRGGPCAGDAGSVVCYCRTNGLRSCQPQKNDEVPLKLVAEARQCPEDRCRIATGRPMLV